MKAIYFLKDRMKAILFLKVRMKAIYFLKVRMKACFTIGAYAHSFAQRCFQDMLKADERDDEYETLAASL